MIPPIESFLCRDRTDVCSDEYMTAALFSRGRLFPEIQTSWVVMTGPPSAGKTTAATFFHHLGLPIANEAAAEVIEEGLQAGYTREQLYSPQVAVARQHAILSRGLRNELALNPEGFRLLDRSWLDAIPFSAELGVPCKGFEQRIELIRYAKVLYFEALPLREASYRPETAAFDALRQRVDERSRIFWKSMGYTLTIIPACSPKGELYTIPERLAIVSKVLGFGAFADVMSRIHGSLTDDIAASPLTDIGRKWCH